MYVFANTTKLIDGVSMYQFIEYCSILLITYGMYINIEIFYSRNLFILEW